MIQGYDYNFNKRCVKWDVLVEGGNDVQKADNGPIYWLGTAVGAFLRALATALAVDSLKEPASAMRSNLVYFVDHYGALPGAKAAAEKLVLILDNLFFSAQEEAEPIKDSLSTEQQVNLVGAIFNFQAVLTSDLGQADVYYITGKRAYDMKILLDNGQWLISNEAWGGLTWSRDKVWQDIREAAKCLALNIPTAVGFHFYRAVEAIITDEYFPLFAIVNPKYRNLGKYIDILTVLGVDERITKELDHLREKYRNPISHPEVFWNQRQADIATNIAIAVIELMAHDILIRKTEYFPRKEES